MSTGTCDPARAALHLERAYTASAEAWGAAVKTGNLKAIEKAQAALDAVKQAQTHLPPAAVATLPPASTLDLGQLSQMQELAPDLAELAGHLKAALQVAERIDLARGRSAPEPVGGSFGWDLAEEVNQLLAAVENQQLGAVGKGLE